MFSCRAISILSVRHVIITWRSKRDVNAVYHFFLTTSSVIMQSHISHTLLLVFWHELVNFIFSTTQLSANLQLYKLYLLIATPHTVDGTMKSFLVFLLSALFAISTVSAFTIPASSTTTTNILSSSRTSTTTKTQLYIFGGPKDDGSPGDYKCLDCNYVFTKGPKAWADLPNNWSCPECGSIKRRFKKVPKGSASAKGGKAAAAEPKKKGLFGF